MKKVFRILMWVVVAAIFIGTLVYLYYNSKSPETHYNQGRPEITTLEKTTVLTGKIEPRDEIDIKPQISGIISEIEVEAGDFIHEGDVIARIKVIPE
ncbi:MAG: HlyD family secretion protein, partial [Muribaculaceae bacterium]|nr:HlyD family secretion protein [Muribaculaceae bacterium]